MNTAAPPSNTQSPVRTQAQKRISAFLAIVTIAGLLCFALPKLGLMDEIEFRTWDWRIRSSVTPGAADSKVKLIEISQASLDIREKDGINWPWPRAIYAAVIKYLELGGAKGAAFDILFTEPSSYGPEDDKEFQQAVQGKLPVVSAVVLTDAAQAMDPQELVAFKKRQNDREASTHFAESFLSYPNAFHFKRVTLPIMELIAASDAFGNVNIAPDSDGVFRHYNPGGFIEGAPVLTLPFALYELVKGAGSVKHEIKDLVDEKGRLSVRFQEAQGSYDPTDIDTILNSYLAIQNGETPQIPPSHFKDAWVFIGVSAPGLLDLRPTPLDERYKGVEYNATVLDNLLNGDFVRKVSTWLNVLYGVVFSGLIACAILFLPNMLAQGIFIPAVFVLQLACAYYLAMNGYWIFLAVPLVASIVSMLFALGVQYQLEGRQHRFIKAAFKYYVSPTVIDQIVANPESLSLGGEKRELSIFFSDIVGFTSISESIDASKLVQLLNLFLSEMTAVILKDDGTVDKYVGDAIVAFWNAPLAVSNHAYKSVRCALNCQARLKELATQFKDEFGVSLRMRVGINTGIVNVGNFGSKERFNYTVVGDAANLASRLEGANKFFGTSTLISDSTYKALDGLIFSRKVADIKVIGKAEVIGVYEPIDAVDEERIKGPEMRIYQDAMSHYERGEIKAALELFQRIPKDPVARVYISRLERDQLAGDSAWSPVWNLSEK